MGAGSGVGNQSLYRHLQSRIGFLLRAGAFLMGMGLLLKHNALADGYFLKGSLTYQAHTVDAAGNPEPRASHSREFEIFVKECTWKVRTRFGAGSVVDYHQYSHDGTNIYYTFKLVKGVHVNMRDPSVAARSSDELLQPVIVEAGCVPRTITSDGAEHVWLAFASGCYFQSLTNNAAVDFTLLESREGGVVTASRRQVGCRYFLSSSPPYLPTEVEYAAYDYASGGAASMTTNDMALGAHFTSESFTNFAGFLLPTRFKYEKFVPDARAKGALRVRVALTVKGIVTFFSLDEPDWEPAIPEERVLISDIREPNVPEPGVMYVASNGVLPSLDDPKLVALRKQSADSATALKASTLGTSASLKRKLILPILMVVFVAPLVVYLLIRTVRNKAR